MSNRITEVLYQKVEVLESANGKPTKIRALVSEADRINRNGRVYPRSVWESNIPKMLEDLDQRPGAAFHPEGEALIPDVAVLWTDLKLDGNFVYAEGEIVPTRVGQDLDACVRAGVRVGVSSRGYGSTKEGMWEGQRAQIIQPDFECETFDTVIRPSSQDARILAYEELEKARNLQNEELIGFFNQRTDSEFNYLMDHVFEAKWTTAYVDSLPDSSFALVKGDNRALPYKDKEGNIDADHVRNALARLNQTKGFSDEEKAAAQSKLQRALKSVGGNPDTNKEDTMNDDKKELTAEELAALEADKKKKGAEDEDDEDEAAKKKSDDDSKPDDTDANDTDEPDADDKKPMKKKSKESTAADSADLTEAASKLAEAVSKIADMTSQLDEAAKNKQHMADAIGALATAASQEVRNGNYYDAGTLSHLAHHVSVINDRDYAENVEKISTTIQTLGTGLGEAKNTVEALTASVASLTEQNAALTAQVTDLEEKAATSLRRTQLIEKLVETSKSEKFSWATFIYLLDNVSDETQIEKKLGEAQKYLSLTLETLGGRAGGDPIVEQKDVRGSKDVAEQQAKTMDMIYTNMLPNRN